MEKISSTYLSNNKSFGVGSRLFALIFLYYASRGSDIIFYITLSVFFILLLGLLIKNLKISYSLSSIFFILILFINFFLSLLAPDATKAYINNQCLWMIVAVIGINIEKHFFINKSNIAASSVWLIGFFLLTIYVATILNPQYAWLFESFFLTDGGEISRYTNGSIRFYTVAAVCFLIIPANGYKKFFSFLINALPLSPVNFIAWFIVHIKYIYLLIFLIISFLIAIFNIEIIKTFSSQFSLFLDDKFLSLISRSEKISELNLVGSSILFDDNFSETFWIALAQSNGLLPALIFFLAFFYKILILSRNILFIFAAGVLTVVNPFPLALIYLLADSWKKGGGK